MIQYFFIDKKLRSSSQKQTLWLQPTLEDSLRVFDFIVWILRRINGLTEEERSDHLTHGLPDANRTHFYGRRFGTTTDWLRCAQDIEADINRQSRRRNHSSHFTDSKSSKEDNPFPQKSFKIGEGVCTLPCKFCRDIGLHEVHWHRDSPNGKKPSEEPSEAEAPTTGSNTYTSMSFLKSRPFDGVSPVLIQASIGHHQIKSFLDTATNLNLVSLRVGKIHEDERVPQPRISYQVYRWSSLITWSRYI